MILIDVARLNAGTPIFLSRVIVSEALLVCKVDITMWPVCAALTGLRDLIFSDNAFFSTFSRISLSPVSRTLTSFESFSFSFFNFEISSSLTSEFKSLIDNI